MSNYNRREGRPAWANLVLALVAGAFLLACGAAALLGGYLAGSSGLAALGAQVLDWLLQTSSVQSMWYVTRSAGIISYLLVWLSTAWGLAVSSKITQGVLHGAFTYEFHQFISLLAIGFIALHVGVLLVDQYMPYTLAQVLVPFLSPYRPLWVGVGVGAMYLTLLVSVTFYMRKRIGQKTFRSIHYTSMLAFAGAALHGLLAGTDSPLAAVQLMYAGTTLVVVFLTAYRIFTALGGVPAPSVHGAQTRE